MPREKSETRRRRRLCIDIININIISDEHNVKYDNRNNNGESHNRNSEETNDEGKKQHIGSTKQHMANESKRNERRVSSEL
mmetsp:Transcript_21305/g.51494  ORF Transcript_21305/g.51494 Transcript_21305/m.51494 type:complete len:81 (+) Transcript_21305:326-568(+)